MLMNLDNFHIETITDSIKVTFADDFYSLT